METDLIYEAQMLDQTLPWRTPTPSGKHHKDELYLRVRPSTTDLE